MGVILCQPGIDVEPSRKLVGFRNPLVVGGTGQMWRLRDNADLMFESGCRIRHENVAVLRE